MLDGEKKLNGKIPYEYMDFEIQTLEINSNGLSHIKYEFEKKNFVIESSSVTFDNDVKIN